MAGAGIEAADWPVPGSTIVKYYLHEDGSLERAGPGADAQPLSYDFDPSRPVPTIGGAFSSLEPVASAGAFNQVGVAGVLRVRSAVSAVVLAV